VFPELADKHIMRMTHVANDRFLEIGNPEILQKAEKVLTIRGSFLEEYESINSTMEKGDDNS
jgi:NDP-sugar pyrophosphorylase family protein